MNAFASNDVERSDGLIQHPHRLDPLQAARLDFTQAQDAYEREERRYLAARDRDENPRVTQLERLERRYFEAAVALAMMRIGEGI